MRRVELAMLVDAGVDVADIPAPQAEEDELKAPLFLRGQVDFSRFRYESNEQQWLKRAGASWESVAGQSPGRSCGASVCCTSCDPGRLRTRTRGRVAFFALRRSAPPVGCAAAPSDSLRAAPRGPVGPLEAADGRYLCS